MSISIETRALRKLYDAPPRLTRGGGGARLIPAQGSQGDGPVVALDGLNLTIPRGEFFGLLGPNGAGKTTTIGILTTRVRATSGEASVGGADVVRDPVSVRRRIGVVPQRPNPDRGLDALENLVFHGTYFGLSASESREKGIALLERLGMVEKANAKVDSLSGGQQQRLMIARALLHEPQVVFLDEPTVGLDPQARLAFWDILRSLHADGRTIVMTTHYMEEADQLCDRVAIIDRGVLLACDAPKTLKASAPGGTLIIVSLDGPAEPVLVAVRSGAGIDKADAVGDDLRVYATRGGEVIPGLIRAAEATGRAVRDIHLVPPSLESLFVSLTGRTLA